MSGSERSDPTSDQAGIRTQAQRVLRINLQPRSEAHLSEGTSSHDLNPSTANSSTKNFFPGGIFGEQMRRQNRRG